MRARILVQVVSFLVIVAVSAMWFKSRATATELQARLLDLTNAHRYTARALERERDRLQSSLADANQPQPTNVTATPSSRVQPTSPRTAPPSLVMGEWRYSRDWRNEGQSTAQKTVATLLWAAAGGDLDTMTRLIVYDEAARKQARVLFDSMPPEARQAFPTPEALVASLTLQAVPNDGAQLSWFHQRDADHATVGLLLGAPSETTPKETGITPAQGNNPPTIVGPNFTQFAAFSLQRSPQGWRIAIPAAAIQRLAKRVKAPAS